MDMKPRFFPSLVLLAVFLASCAPATPETAATSVILEGTPTIPAPTSTAPATATPAMPTESPAPTPLPIATSRGPNLEATDPSTVNLASGQLQFVEFFRFT